MNFWPLMENIITDKDLDVLINFIKTTKRFTQFTRVREFETAFSKRQDVITLYLLTQVVPLT
jgi:hypothetical protein